MVGSEDDTPNPVEVHELSRDILRASEEHFVGIKQETVVYALVALANDIVQETVNCSAQDAALYVRTAADEIARMKRGQ